jgi:hypothetical protein
MAHGTPLPESTRNRLAKVVERDGEELTLRTLGVSRATLARALAGLGLRTVSCIAIEARLRVFDSGEERS